MGPAAATATAATTAATRKPVVVFYFGTQGHVKAKVLRNSRYLAPAFE